MSKGSEPMADQEVQPFWILFMCHVRSARFRTFTREMLELLDEHGFGKIGQWQTAAASGETASALEKEVSGFPDDPPRDGRPLYVEFLTRKGVNGGTQFDVTDSGVELSIVDLRRVVGEGDSRDDLFGFQRQCLALCRTMMKRFDVYAAQLRPESGGAECVPEVPLVSGNSHFAVTNEDEVLENYDAPDDFWNAGWELAEEGSGQRLLTRHLDVVAGPEYLECIRDPQWRMARAAKPGLTTYASPVVIPEEKHVYCAGKKRLHFVGYDPDERLIEYSCALEEGQHVHGWEIYALLDIIEQQRTPDGAPVDAVRVVFLDEWAARQEKRPLLDIGCRVCHYDEDGELRELTE